MSYQPDYGLYIVVTDPVAGYEAVALAAVKTNTRYLQLRIKDRSRREVTRVAESLQDIVSGSETYLIINDDPYVAAEVCAAGVHLGQEDIKEIPISKAREIAGPDVFVGLSVHDEEEMAVAIREQPDYIGVGRLFPTTTKPGAPPIGIDGAAELARKSPFPYVAISGINKDNVTRVIEAGFEDYAVTRAVCLSEDPVEAIIELANVTSNL
ncbi:MAG: thiamine phosphate synthase [bacterium]|nr:thiamine phosphate synthase [bacterium]